MSTQNYDSQPWTLSKSVLPQHTDHAGVVWHGTYLNWLEEARVDALSQVGLAYREISNEGFEMPVVSLEINYISPLVHGEKVLLESWALSRQGIRWPWKTKFLREDLVCVAKAKVFLALVRRENNQLQLVRNAPAHINRALLNLQLGPKTRNS